ncbi:MAG: SpoIIE family protein phosphatase [Phycisphaerae bacterium]
MRLTILENRRLRNSLQLNGGTVTIGSNPDCNVHLPDPRLGKHQANISQDDEGAWWLEVLDRSIPTCLNRAVQKTRARLRHADEIEMGVFSIRFFLESKKSREELHQERLLALTKQHGDTLPLGTIIEKANAEMTTSRDLLEQMTLLAMRLSRMESISEALPPLLRAMIRTFNAKRAWIGVRKRVPGDFDWTLCQSHKGEACVRPSFSEKTQPRCLDLSQNLCTPTVPVKGVGSAMAAPLVGQGGNLGMLYVENDTGDTPYDQESLNSFEVMASCMAMPIESVLRQTMALRQAAAITVETIARATQDALTPKALPRWEELQVAAYRHMGTEHCTDFYDIVQLRDKKAAVIVAKMHVDALESPRYLSELRAAFRSAALYSEAPHLFARAVNWILYDGDSKTRLDLAATWICPKTGEIQYCLAGRNVMGCIIHADGSCEMIPIEPTPSIGQTRSPVYEAIQFVLAPGDALALATDGVKIARNETGEAFGFEGLEETLCDGLGDTPGHVLDEFARDLTEYVTGGSHPEDITTMLVRRE